MSQRRIWRQRGDWSIGSQNRIRARRSTCSTRHCWPSKGSTQPQPIQCDARKIHARDSHLSFVAPFLKRVSAISELGLRNFSRARQVVDQLEVQARKDNNSFLAIEARLIRCRLLVAQGFSEEAAALLRVAPDAFPFEDERGEFLASLALAEACAGHGEVAINLADGAAAISRTVEVRVLAPCVHAIVALGGSAADAPDQARAVSCAISELGNVDSFVVAYRGHPRCFGR